MRVNKLDHVNVATARMDDMLKWYETVLGLTTGPRPDFPFPGAWIYVGDTAAIHLVGHDGAPKVGSEVGLKLEHFAFSATGRSEFEARLEAKGESFEKVEIKSAGFVQFHLSDPDGNHIHVDFPIDE